MVSSSLSGGEGGALVARQQGGALTSSLERERERVGLVSSPEGDDIVVLGALEDLAQGRDLDNESRWEGWEAMSSTRVRGSGEVGERLGRTLIPSGSDLSHR